MRTSRQVRREARPFFCKNNVFAIYVSPGELTAERLGPLVPCVPFIKHFDQCHGLGYGYQSKYQLLVPEHGLEGLRLQLSTTYASDRCKSLVDKGTAMLEKVSQSKPIDQQVLGAEDLIQLLKALFP